jgi:predicted GH43/DUF377 family glycosyl hydrolase
MKTNLTTPKTFLLIVLTLFLIGLGFMVSGTSLAHDVGIQPAQLHSLQSNEPGTWTKYAGNPVVSSTEQWEGGFIWGAHILKDGTVYKMWYAGIQPSHIGYATSADGIGWAKLSTNPVLDPGAPGAWDDNGISEPFVMKDNDVYKMWYWGKNSDGIMQIGYAVSPDGISWVKYLGNPVLTVDGSGTWDSIEVGTPWVLLQDGLYKMWYLGQDSSGQYATGYATSTDGIHWTKYSGNPILSGTADSWDTKGVLATSVLFDGVNYRLWYFGKDATGIDRIGYTTSLDGIHWTKSSKNPILGLGSGAAWDSISVAFPKVIMDNGVYKMWYLGSDGMVGKYGYATAPELHFTYLPIISK